VHCDLVLPPSRRRVNRRGCVQLSLFSPAAANRETALAYHPTFRRRRFMRNNNIKRLIALRKRKTSCSHTHIFIRVLTGSTSSSSLPTISCARALAILLLLLLLFTSALFYVGYCNIMSIHDGARSPPCFPFFQNINQLELWIFQFFPIWYIKTVMFENVEIFFVDATRIVSRGDTNFCFSKEEYPFCWKLFSR